MNRPSGLGLMSPMGRIYPGRDLLGAVAGELDPVGA